ncbi:MAG: DUF429 domain-containing protein [Deltaproteobacteria bacterium]|nr:DUF429 domain-containing protein [Deltaproteobacteria bacterium]
MGTTEEHSFETFIGIDLGGGKGKNTAVAMLARSDEGVRVRFVGRKDRKRRPFYDEHLVAYLRAHHAGALVAVDAPLTRTVCTRCVLPRCPGLAQCSDPVVEWFRGPGVDLAPKRTSSHGKPLSTPYTQRACEVVLYRRYGILPRETLGQGMGPLTARAHYLRRALEDIFERDRNLIEVYPKATIHRIFGADVARRYKRGADTWRVRAEMLETLSEHLRFDIWREGCLRDDHAFDAVLCAYTAYLYHQQSWQLPEAGREIFAQDGWIWFPRPEEGLVESNGSDEPEET